MDKRIKKLWVDALMSGEYKQGDSWLNRNDKFCCLGVLCDVHKKDTGNGYWDPTPDSDDKLAMAYFVGSQCSDSLLPDAVKKWGRLDERLPRAGNKSLASLNDSGYSFAEIAAIIEMEL